MNCTSKNKSWRYGSLLQRRQHGLWASTEVSATHVPPPAVAEKLELLLIWVVVSRFFTALCSHCGGVLERWVGHRGGSFGQTPPPPAGCRGWLCGCGPLCHIFLWSLGQNTPNLERLISYSQISNGRPNVSLVIWSLPGVSLPHFIHLKRSSSWQFIVWNPDVLISMLCTLTAASIYLLEKNTIFQSMKLMFKFLVMCLYVH